MSIDDFDSGAAADLSQLPDISITADVGGGAPQPLTLVPDTPSDINGLDLPPDYVVEVPPGSEVPVNFGEIDYTKFELPEYSNQEQDLRTDFAIQQVMADLQSNPDTIAIMNALGDGHAINPAAVTAADLGGGGSSVDTSLGGAASISPKLNFEQNGFGFTMLGDSAGTAASAAGSSQALSNFVNPEALPAYHLPENSSLLSAALSYKPANPLLTVVPDPQFVGPANPEAAPGSEGMMISVPNIDPALQNQNLQTGTLPTLSQLPKFSLTSAQMSMLNGTSYEGAGAEIIAQYKAQQLATLANAQSNINDMIAQQGNQAALAKTVIQTVAGGEAGSLQTITDGIVSGSYGISAEGTVAALTILSEAANMNSPARTDMIKNLNNKYDALKANYESQPSADLLAQVNDVAGQINAVVSFDTKQTAIEKVIQANAGGNAARQDAILGTLKDAQQQLIANARNTANEISTTLNAAYQEKVAAAAAAQAAARAAAAAQDQAALSSTFGISNPNAEPGSFAAMANATPVIGAAASVPVANLSPYVGNTGANIGTLTNIPVDINGIEKSFTDLSQPIIPTIDALVPGTQAYKDNQDYLNAKAAAWAKAQKNADVINANLSDGSTPAGMIAADVIGTGGAEVTPTTVQEQFRNAAFYAGTVSGATFGLNSDVAAVRGVFGAVIGILASGGDINNISQVVDMYNSFRNDFLIQQSVYQNGSADAFSAGQLTGTGAVALILAPIGSGILVPSLIAGATGAATVVGNRSADVSSSNLIYQVTEEGVKQALINAGITFTAGVAFKGIAAVVNKVLIEVKAGTSLTTDLALTGGKTLEPITTLQPGSGVVNGNVIAIPDSTGNVIEGFARVVPEPVGLPNNLAIGNGVVKGLDEVGVVAPGQVPARIPTQIPAQIPDGVVKPVTPALEGPIVAEVKPGVILENPTVAGKTTEVVPDVAIVNLEPPTSSVVEPVVRVPASATPEPVIAVPEAASTAPVQVVEPPKLVIEEPVAPVAEVKPVDVSVTPEPVVQKPTYLTDDQLLSAKNEILSRPPMADPVNQFLGVETLSTLDKSLLVTFKDLSTLSNNIDYQRLVYLNRPDLMLKYPGVFLQNVENYILKLDGALTQIEISVVKSNELRNLVISKIENEVFPLLNSAEKTELGNLLNRFENPGSSYGIERNISPVVLENGVIVEDHVGLQFVKANVDPSGIPPLDTRFIDLSQNGLGSIQSNQLAIDGIYSRLLVDNYQTLTNSANKLIDDLMSNIKAAGYKLEFSSELGAYDGFQNPIDKIIKISSNLSDSEKLSVLTHEWGHVKSELSSTLNNSRMMKIVTGTVENFSTIERPNPYLSPSQYFIIDEVPRHLEEAAVLLSEIRRLSSGAQISSNDLQNIINNKTKIEDVFTKQIDFINASSDILKSALNLVNEVGNKVMLNYNISDGVVKIPTAYFVNGRSATGTLNITIQPGTLASEIPELIRAHIYAGQSDLANLSRQVVDQATYARQLFAAESKLITEQIQAGVDFNAVQSRSSISGLNFGGN